MKRMLLLILFIITATQGSPIIVAHRGASGHALENSMAAFKKALAMHAPMVELDVYVCKTGEVVVMHDATIDRTTNGKGAVSNMSLHQLRKYKLRNGEAIPLLSEVIDTVQGRAIINIELKTDREVEPVARLLNAYMQGKKAMEPSKFMVTSFNHYAVKEFKVLCPQVKTGAIFEGIPIGYADIVVRAGAQYAILYIDSVVPAFIADAHAKQIQVFAYTVNDKATAEHLERLGVDGIITNYPAILS